MGLSKTEILRGIGFLKGYSIPEIAISGTYRVPISDFDIDLCIFFNTLDIVNDDAVNIDVYLDGNSARCLRVIQGQNKSMNGTRYRDLVVKNLSAASVVTANKIFVTIQKELGIREQQELIT
jgi:hypothetical protein